MDHAWLPVTRGGRLFIAIYNDRGWISNAWRKVKRLYCSGLPGRMAVTGGLVPALMLSGLLKDLLRLRNPWRRYADYQRRRGMSLMHDWLDWLGGYPFEVARPEQILEFYRRRGMFLEKLKTTLGDGTNQFLFRRPA
jgi:2-polyprenyl-6-hydroxyphenyl methylase/3-demethylubiquinone-9 3-methyltransferase